MLRDNLRFKLTLSVPWDLQLDLALAAADRLLEVTVAAVVRLLVPVIALAVPQFVFQFSVHDFLNQAAGQFLHQRMKPIKVFDASFINELPQRTLLPFDRVFFLRHFILSPDRGLHNLFRSY